MRPQRFLIAGLLVALVAAACTSSESEADSAAQVQAATDLANSLSAIQATTADTERELASLGPRLDNLEAAVSSAETHALDRTAGIPDPPDGQIAVRISFGYFGEPLPGDGVVAYTPDPAVSTVWAMESLDAGQPLPVGEPLEASTFFLTPGDRMAVTLAYTNPTGEAVSFMAVPHQDSPGSLNGKIWPQCLCFSFAYEAPASGSWYRVIEFGSDAGIEPGSKIDILWNFHTDPALFPTE